MIIIERKQLKQLLEHEGFNVLLKIANEMIQKYAENPKKRETEFDTLWALASDEASIQAIKQLLNNIEKEAYDNRTE